MSRPPAGCPASHCRAGGPSPTPPASRHARDARNTTTAAVARQATTTRRGKRGSIVNADRTSMKFSCTDLRFRIRQSVRALPNHARQHGPAHWRSAGVPADAALRRPICSSLSLQCRRLLVLVGWEWCDRFIDRSPSDVKRDDSASRELYSSEPDDAGVGDATGSGRPAT